MGGQAGTADAIQMRNQILHRIPASVVASRIPSERAFVDLGGPVPAALDALVIALYVEIDDHVVPPRQGRGRRPRLTDAELICLAVAQVLLGIDGEHRWIRFARFRAMVTMKPSVSGPAPPMFSSSTENPAPSSKTRSSPGR